MKLPVFNHFLTDGAIDCVVSYILENPDNVDAMTYPCSSYDSALELLRRLKAKDSESKIFDVVPHVNYVNVIYNRQQQFAFSVG